MLMGIYSLPVFYLIKGVNMKYTYNQAMNIIQHIVDNNYQLSEWEDDFISSIIEREKDLTVKQSECLEKLYEKSK